MKDSRRDNRWTLASQVLIVVCLLALANISHAQHPDADASWQAAERSAVETCSCHHASCNACPSSPAGRAPTDCAGVCRDPGFPAKPKCKKPGDIDRGDCPPLRYRMSDCQRAGRPHQVARWAQCSVTKEYSAWYVGGGAPFCKGRPRKETEGTWGLDYSGLLGRANIWLKYTRGRQQGGEGAYQTDGEPGLVSRVHHLLHR